VEGSYTEIGNDASHFNLDINAGTNSAVSAEIADALHAASDHLPVMLKLAYPTDIIISIEDDEALPEGFVLKQNYPNPFNPETVIEYSIPKSGDVSLIVYNILGQDIVQLIQESQKAGTYRIKWNASTRPSGLYFYRFQAGDFVQMRKMVLLK